MTTQPDCIHPDVLPLLAAFPFEPVLPPLFALLLNVRLTVWPPISVDGVEVLPARPDDGRCGLDLRIYAADLRNAPAACSVGFARLLARPGLIA